MGTKFVFDTVETATNKLDRATTLLADLRECLQIQMPIEDGNYNHSSLNQAAFALNAFTDHLIGCKDELALYSNRKKLSQEGPHD